MDNRSLSHTKWKCQYHIVFFQNTARRYYTEKFGMMCER